jgi:hypothetical protein
MRHDERRIPISSPRLSANYQQESKPGQLDTLDNEITYLITVLVASGFQTNGIQLELVSWGFAAPASDTAFAPP